MMNRKDNTCYQKSEVPDTINIKSVYFRGIISDKGAFFDENLEETDKNAKYNLEEMPGSCYNKDIFGR